MLVEIAIWMPAIILPFSTALQLVKTLKTKEVEGVSALSWFLFGIANIGAFIMTGKFTSLPAILAFPLTTVLDFAIVAAVLILRKREKKSQ